MTDTFDEPMAWNAFNWHIGHCKNCVQYDETGVLCREGVELSDAWEAIAKKNRYPMSARAEKPVVGTCSKCRENALFEWDSEEGEYMSNCCWRYRLDPDAQ